MSVARYDMRWVDLALDRDGRAVQRHCLDCGAVVADREVHDRFHAILNDTARAVAILIVAHITASTHDRYEAYDKIQAGRNRNNWSAEALAEVAADALATPEAGPSQDHQQ